MRFSKFLVFLMVSLVILSEFAVFRLVPFVEANPSWLTGWSYRKSHVINYASGAGTNYQIKVTAHYGSGTDSGGDVYLNSHCRTDFGDVRFTDDDGTTLLDYWMESKTNSDNAVFWVEVADDLSTVNATIYIYYGKSDATTTSNGETTFPFFDDMDNYNIGDSLNSSKWTTEGLDETNTVTIQADPADDSKKCIRLVESDDGVYTSMYALMDAKYLGLAFHCRVYIITYGSRNDAQWKEDATLIAVNSRALSTYTWKWHDGSSYQPFSPDLTIALNTWQDEIFKFVDTGKSYMHLVAGGTDGTGGFYGTPTNGPNKLQFTQHKLAAATMYIGGLGTNNRFIFARKLVTPEPSHGSWGSEEVPTGIASKRLLVGVGL